MALQQRVETVPRTDFWSQMPVVLFAAIAVAAIVFVNARSQAAAQPEPAPAPPTDVQLAPVGCAECGEVIAVRAAEGNEAAVNPALHPILLDIRMSDGTVRTVRQLAPGFDVGDRVLVNGNALVARS